MANSYFGSVNKSNAIANIPYRWDVVNAYPVKPEDKKEDDGSIRVIDGIRWAFNFDGDSSCPKGWYNEACRVLCAAIRLSKINPKREYNRMFSLHFDKEERVLTIGNPKLNPKDALERVMQMDTDPNRLVRTLNNSYLNSLGKSKLGSIRS